MADLQGRLERGTLTLVQIAFAAMGAAAGGVLGYSYKLHRFVPEHFVGETPTENMAVLWDGVAGGALGALVLWLCVGRIFSFFHLRERINEREWMRGGAKPPWER